MKRQRQPGPSAEESFHGGLTLLNEQRADEAAGCFRTAINVSSNAGSSPDSRGRYLSYYGLSLCMSRSNMSEALDYCRQASRLDRYHPSIWWNLARVAKSAGKRAEAYRALRRALDLKPGHAGIIRDLRRMGIRRKPVLPFLARRNPFNVLLGKFRKPTLRPRPSGRNLVRLSGHHG